QAELPDTKSNTTNSSATTMIDRGGVRVAALIHDVALVGEPELLAAVAAAAGMALDNGRLRSELHARLEELRGSRVRIIEAGPRARQRPGPGPHTGRPDALS